MFQQTQHPTESSRSRFGRVATILGLAFMMGACAQSSSLYTWDSYQPMVYTYLKAEDNDHLVQIQGMEENVQSASARNQALPPGFRAHLGLLYLKTGDGAKAVELLEAEKQAFPEATAYMDFLLRNLKSGASQPSDPAANTPQPVPAQEQTHVQQKKT